MAERMVAESTCDRCGTVERREQAVPFTPAAWRFAKIGYMGTNGFVAENSSLLCERCTSIVLDALDPILARASRDHA
jgi:hypothetical protein